MLALCLSIREELYAIAARSVVEVVPQVLLRSLPGAPAYVAGLLAYRGELITVVDLGRRLIDVSARNCLSTRIVVVQRAAGAQPPRYGLLAERISDIRKLQGELVPAGSEAGGLLVGAMLEKGTAISVLNVDAVLPARFVALPQEAS